MRQVSERYTRRRQEVALTAGDPGALAARLRFFLPRDLFKVWGPLDELAAVGALPTATTPKVLDLGAGLGTTTLGLSSFTAAAGSAQGLVVHAVDRDRQALSVMKRLLAPPAGPPGLSCAPVTLTTYTNLLEPAHWSESLPDGPYDIIVLGLCLNELLATIPDVPRRVAEGEALLRRLSESLSDDGVMIVIEPALREQARTLAAIRDRLVGGRAPPHVFAPCVGCPTCPMLARQRDWCHEDIPWELPAALAEIAGAAGLRRAGLTYSYLTLHARPRSLAELAVVPAHARRVVSAPLPSKGKLELELCGPEGGTRMMALNRDRRRDPDVLSDLGRGTVLALAPDDIDDSKRGARARLLPGRSPRVLRRP